MLGGKGIDIVVDVAGTGALSASASLLNESGMIAAIGMLDGSFSWDRKEIDGRPIVPIHVGNRERHEAMLAFAARHGIRPVVDVVYDLDRLSDALRQLESRTSSARSASICSDASLSPQYRRGG
jgi:D-arabinose 1-dehydrogenase-like Zn-dependent alcohol dehydrogenase